jgi:hypothetical protein
MDPKEVRAIREILAMEPKAIFHVVHYGNQVRFKISIISKSSFMNLNHYSLYIKFFF